MTLVIYREDGSMEHIQCDMRQENAIAMFSYRQSKYAETLHYDILKGDLTPRMFKQAYYVSYPEGVRRRPSMTISLDKLTILADGQDSTTLTGCPEGAEVYVGGSFMGVVDADGTVEVSTTLPGKIIIELKLIPYLAWKGEVDVA